MSKDTITVIEAGQQRVRVQLQDRVNLAMDVMQKNGKFSISGCFTHLRTKRYSRQTTISHARLGDAFAAMKNLFSESVAWSECDSVAAYVFDKAQREYYEVNTLTFDDDVTTEPATDTAAPKREAAGGRQGGEDYTTGYPA